MTIFHNFTQENYNSLKLFLISKYHIRLLPGEKENTQEHLEVKNNDTVVGVTFYKDDSLEILPNNEESTIYKEIVRKIQQISPTSDGKDQNNDFSNRDFDDIVKLFLHMSECNSCKEKFEDIWNHYKIT